MKIDDLKKGETNRVVWVFWDGPTKPPLIDVCIQSMHRNAGLPVIELNVERARTLLGNFNGLIMDRYHWAHKVDVVRLELLRQYGGIYLDADILVLKSLVPLMDEAEKHNRFILTSHDDNTGKFKSDVSKLNNGFLIAPANHTCINSISSNTIANNYTNTKMGNLAALDNDWSLFMRIMLYTLAHTRGEYRYIPRSDFIHTGEGEHWNNSEFKPFGPLNGRSISEHYDPSVLGYFVYNSSYKKFTNSDMKLDDFLELDSNLGFVVRQAFGANRANEITPMEVL